MDEHIKRENVVEIVRCKDCKHRPFFEIGMNYAETRDGSEICPYLCDDPWYNRVPPDEGFCYLGEIE